jgi:GxxExxY protein
MGEEREEDWCWIDESVDAEDALRIAESRCGYQFEPESFRVIGAAKEVLRRLGPGFREDLYEKALCMEFDRRGISYEQQVEIIVRYDDRPIGTHTLDLIIEGKIVVELKAVSGLAEAHTAQLISYLRASDLRVGLLLNFGQIPLGVKRVVNSYKG